MGISIDSKNMELDCGYGGFIKFRNFISCCMDSYYKCNGELEEHYRELIQSSYLFNDKYIKEFFDKYDNETHIIQKKYKIPQYVLTFLYQADTNGSLSVAGTKKLYDIIKNSKTDMTFGYSDSEWTFEEFVKLLADCIENNVGLKWS